MTQDGRVARQLIGEDSEIEKEYLVRVSYGAETLNVQAVFPRDKLALLRHGLSLDGQPLRPAQVGWQNPEQLRFVLREGKKRQIRRMCEQVGLFVTGLKRVLHEEIYTAHYIPDQRYNADCPETPVNTTNGLIIHHILLLLVPLGQASLPVF